MQLLHLILLLILHITFIQIITSKSKTKKPKEDEFTEYINWSGYNKIYKYPNLNFAKEEKNLITIYKLYKNETIKKYYLIKNPIQFNIKHNKNIRLNKFKRVKRTI